MRILSDFKDYYDAGMALGYDPTLVYRRYRRVEAFPPKATHPFPREWVTWTRSPYWVLLQDRSERLSVEGVSVGFCGRAYTALRVGPRDAGDQSKADRARTKLCYSVDDVDTYVRTHFTPAEYEAYRRPKADRRAGWPWGQRREDFARAFADKYGDTYQGREDPTWKPYFEATRCPVFVFRPGRGFRDPDTLTYHDRLKDLEFYRVVDATQAYQQIAQWLANQAEPRKPIPPLPDETMAEIKGFDEWSFRTPPGGGKKRKRGKA